MDLKIKEKLMRIAINEAEKAINEGNSPFGAVLSDSKGNVIEIAHNTTNTDLNPIAHAEINLITKAVKKLKTKDLSNYYLICSAQSCSMCFSGAIKAKIKNFIFGCAEDDTLKPKINVFQLSKYHNEKLNIESKILEKECLNQLNRFRNFRK